MSVKEVFHKVDGRKDITQTVISSYRWTTISKPRDEKGWERNDHILEEVWDSEEMALRVGEVRASQGYSVHAYKLIGFSTREVNDD